MDATERTIIETAEEAIERAKTDSQQPRFTSNADSVFSALMGWLKRAKELQEPEYRSDSRKRDEWLRDFAILEPHWSGALQQTVMIDSNRGWMMVGGRNQVNRYTTMMHNAEDGKGWRIFSKKCSRAFRVADMCSVVETGRQGRNGPLRSLYNVDPARCKLTGRTDYPLYYYPPNGTMQKWRNNDFFRVISFPSTNEKFNDLGFCATSMALELVKLMYGVLTHDQEVVGSRMPEGLLLLQGIDQTQFDQSLRAREGQLDAKMRRYFGGVHVLATSGVGGETLDARLVALSNLPANFDQETFINQTMYGYALVLGYAPGEFWPITGSVLGRGKEEETQHQRATTKGGMDWALSFTEQLQNELPDSIHFQFEERDEQGELLQAQVAQSWANVVNSLYTWPNQFQQGLLNEYQAREMLAAHNIIPTEWTETEDAEIATDTESAEVRKRWLENGNVRRSCERYPNDPIVLYRWTGGIGREVVLWDSGADALRPRVWAVKKRQDDDNSAVLFADDDVTITEADVDRAISDGERRVGIEFSEMLNAQPLPDERGISGLLNKLRGIKLGG